MAIGKETVSFLKDLAANNNRDWLQANKKEFEKAKDDFAEFVGELIAGISQFDPDVGGLAPDACIFRIYRDIRFSKDKSPYKTNFGAYISPGGRKTNSPGYYIHIQPGGQSFLAGGKHMPESHELLAMRRAVADKTDEFLKVIGDKDFKKLYGELYGEKLKTAPKGFPADHPAIEYLKFKSFTVAHALDKDKMLTVPDFSAYVVSACKAMKPFIDFLRKALAK
jgi:uncharacterized protein (TIGR02453 family)